MPSGFIDDQDRTIISLLVRDDQTGTDSEVEVAADPKLQEKNATPTEAAQRITPDASYDALSAVNLSAIPSSYVIPSGTEIITQNGTMDVRRLAYVSVNVGEGGHSGGPSSAQAKAYHSITIGTKNTWDDWHLVPTSRPTFAMPPVKTSFVDIPGGDGSLDLTTALTGRPVYGNRQGSFEFLVMNDYGYWADRYSEIAGYLHGQNFRAILDDDPEYYYEGRFSVNQWKSDPHWSLITINYNVGPYKKSLLSIGERWLWDPFDFETGVIKVYKNIVVNGENDDDGTYTTTYIGDSFEISPIITCSKVNNDTPFRMTMTFKGQTFTLNPGTNVLDTITFDEGDNELTFVGKGRVSIENVGGRL